MCNSWSFKVNCIFYFNLLGIAIIAEQNLHETWRQTCSCSIAQQKRPTWGHRSESQRRWHGHWRRRGLVLFTCYFCRFQCRYSLSMWDHMSSTNPSSEISHAHPKTEQFMSKVTASVSCKVNNWQTISKISCPITCVFTCVLVKEYNMYRSNPEKFLLHHTTSHVMMRSVIIKCHI